MPSSSDLEVRAARLGMESFEHVSLDVTPCPSINILAEKTPDGDRDNVEDDTDTSLPFNSKQHNAHLLLCAVSLIDGADMQLLPACFHALELDLGLSPAGLGQMSLAQSLFQSTFAPLWGILADHTSRKVLLVASCAAWGLLTILLACVSSFWAVFLLRCAHGATLASLSPIAQSMVADISSHENRGIAFGHLQFATLCGQILSALFGTWIASETLLFGLRGWRFAFIAVACVSLITSGIVGIFMEEPSRVLNSTRQSNFSVRFFLSELGSMFHFFCIPTFTVIVLQGLAGCVPWNALGFLPMYIQYSGHTSATAALVMSSSLVGCAFGGLLGGRIGDALARRKPAHGRPCTAQLSVIMGVPSICILIQLAPDVDAIILMAIAISFGLVASWCAVGVNRPIMIEIVDPSRRAAIVAWLSALEGSFAALFGAPVVGFLAEEAFHYQQVSDISLLTDEVRINNGRALGSALMWTTVLPWLLCFSLYSLLHFTYSSDVARVQAKYAEFREVASPPELDLMTKSSALPASHVTDTSDDARDCSPSSPQKTISPRRDF